MPKVMIEVDVPEGRSVSEAEAAVKRCFDDNWFASWWHTSDIHSCANGWGDDDAKILTDEEAAEVLRLAEKYHDANIGINWDVLSCWIDQVKKTNPVSCCICKEELDREDLELVDDGSGDRICIECMHPEGEES